MSIINNALSGYAIFLINIPNDLKGAFSSLFSDQNIDVKEVFSIQDSDDILPIIDTISLFEKSLVLVNFTSNPKVAFSFVIKMKYGENPHSKKANLLMIGNVEKDYERFSSLDGVLDAFVALPFVKGNALQSLTNFSLDVIRPSPYTVMLDVAKEQLESNQLDLANILLEKAKDYHPRPAQAVFLAAHIKELQGDELGGFKMYSKALKHNKTHYMSLMALFRILVKQERAGDAFKVLKRMFSTFPAPGAILAKFIENCALETRVEILVMMDENFKEIADDDNRPELKLTVSELASSMVTSLLEGKRQKEAATVFYLGLKYGADLGAEMMRVKPMIITSKLIVFYEELWRNLPGKVKAKKKMAEIEVEIIDHIFTPETALSKVRGLLKTYGSEVRYAYEVAIKNASKINLDDVTEKYVREAIKRWPDAGPSLREFTKHKPERDVS